MNPSFIELEATGDDHVWHLPLVPRLCVGPPGKMFMFGGVGLGSAIAALEKSCGRRVIWATAQYVSYARPPSVVELTVTELNAGKYNTQARVTSRVDGQEILTVNAALGSRPSEVTRQWLALPDVLPPDQCPPISRFFMRDESLHRYLDTRLASLRSDDANRETERGHILLWIKPHENHRIDPEMLAIMADFVPMGVGRALGQMMGGNSLDNTIRIHQIVPTEWVLCDLKISGVHDGFGHGDMALFAEDGRLMATAGQSLIIRSFNPDMLKAMAKGEDAGS